MEPLIDTLILTEPFSHYQIRSNVTVDLRLGPLGKLNIFVGANNSGKSRLMRSIASQETSKLLWIPRLSDPDPREADMRNLWVSGCREIVRAISAHGGSTLPDIKSEAEHFSLLFQKETFPFLEYGKCAAFFAYLQALRNRMKPSEGWLRQLLTSLNQTSQHNLGQLENHFGALRSKLQRKKLYVPTLRSLRHITGNDEFSQRTKEQYFNNSDEVEIFTGQTLYQEIEDLLRGDLASRAKLRRFEEFLSGTFFNGRPIALIPRKGQRELTVKIGDEEERPIHQLGEGIQSIISVTFPLFKASDEALVAFIEEPELFLHPWLQRVLLEVFSKRFPRHQYFVTTHSNHFLDLTLDLEDVSVFAFEKELEEVEGQEKPARFLITNVSRDSRKLLELLGVRNSSVLLTNCTVWVEGITDRRYFSHWLDLYQTHLNVKPRFREDLHFSFVEYGGGNITHWSFLDDIEDPIDVEKLCGKLFLITDRDSEKAAKKSERHAKLAKCLGNRLCVLPCREVENLLPPSVLVEVLKDYGEDESKLPTFPHSSYKAKPLGAFIEQALGGNKVRKGRYAAESGTITDKVVFCRHAVQAMKKWDELPAEAQELTAKIYEFIKTCNSN